MDPRGDLNLPEEKTDKSKVEDADNLAREGSAEVVSQTDQANAASSQSMLNEAEDILNREELESEIESDITTSVDDSSEAVTLTETYETNSDFSFMIYDNLNEKFDQLEKSFENKSHSIVKSLDESEAFDYIPTGEIPMIRTDDLGNELPSKIRSDTLDITQNTYKTEDIVKEEKTKEDKTEGVEDNISDNIEPENTKEEQSVSVLFVWLLVMSFTVFCNLNVVKYLVLELN